MQDVARDLHSLTLFCEHIVQTIFETDLVLVGATPLKQKRPVNQKHVKAPMLNLLLPVYFDHERPSKSSRLEFDLGGPDAQSRWGRDRRPTTNPSTGKRTISFAASRLANQRSLSAKVSDLWANLRSTIILHNESRRVLQ